MAKVYATGKRKTAIAKVWLNPGKGKLVINDITLDEWLGGHEAIKKKVLQPLVLTGQEKAVDIKAVTFGGGYSAQAEALRHGISKALNAYDIAFRSILKPKGQKKRKSRLDELKKHGNLKARRSQKKKKR